MPLWARTLQAVSNGSHAGAENRSVVKAAGNDGVRTMSIHALECRSGWPTAAILFPMAIAQRGEAQERPLQHAAAEPGGRAPPIRSSARELDGLRLDSLGESRPGDGGWLGGGYFVWRAPTGEPPSFLASLRMATSTLFSVNAP